MEIQRAVKTHIHRSVNKVNAIVLVSQQIDQLIQKHLTISKGIEIIPNLIAAPVFSCFAPDRNIEHLQHPLFDTGELIEIHIVQSRQQIQQERNPTP